MVRDAKIADKNTIDLHVTRCNDQVKRVPSLMRRLVYVLIEFEGSETSGSVFP